MSKIILTRHIANYKFQVLQMDTGYYIAHAYPAGSSVAMRLDASDKIYSTLSAALTAILDYLEQEAIGEKSEVG